MKNELKKLAGIATAISISLSQPAYAFDGSTMFKLAEKVQQTFEDLLDPFFPKKDDVHVLIDGFSDKEKELQEDLNNLLKGLSSDLKKEDQITIWNTNPNGVDKFNSIVLKDNPKEEFEAWVSEQKLKLSKPMRVNTKPVFDNLRIITQGMDLSADKRVLLVIGNGLENSNWANLSNTSNPKRGREFFERLKDAHKFDYGFMANVDVFAFQIVGVKQPDQVLAVKETWMRILSAAKAPKIHISVAPINPKEVF